MTFIARVGLNHSALDCSALKSDSKLTLEHIKWTVKTGKKGSYLSVLPTIFLAKLLNEVKRLFTQAVREGAKLFALSGRCELVDHCC